MRSVSGISRLLVILTLMALPFIVGSSCAFFFSSGGGSGGTIVKDDDDDDDDEEEEEPRFVQTGAFSSPAVEGVNYASDSVAGVTGADGSFRYVDGETVRFSIGDIALGAPVQGKPALTPQDLAAEDAVAAINIARLLHSLDVDPSDDVVTIPADVRSAAVLSNASVAPAIEFLDFSDDAAFGNAASQLVSSLTGDYPHTATLVDAQSVKANKAAVPGVPER